MIGATPPSDPRRDDADKASPAGPRTRGGQPRSVLALLSFVYLVFYARTATFDYVWDDSVNSPESELLRGPLAQVIRRGEHARVDPAMERMPKDIVPKHESYRPVSATSHWLDVHLFHNRPGLFHLHNVVLGLLSIVLVWRLSRALALGPWLTCLWALHPLHVEVFAYISARSDLLAAIFSLSALLAALRSAEASDARTRWTFAAVASLAQLLSLFSKEANIALPLAVIALAVARGRLRASLVSVMAMLAATAAYFPIRRALMLATSLPMAQKQAVVRAFADLPGLALAYATSFVLPISLSPDRQLWPGFVPFGRAAAAVLLGGLVLTMRRARPESLIHLKLAASALAAYGVLLLPAALGLRSIGALADRYVFFPLFFLALSFLALARSLKPALANLPAVLRVGPLVAWGVLLLATSWLQIGAWRNEETLARHAVAMDPDNAAALYRLATVETTRGSFRAALPLLERAVTLDPSNQKALGNLSVTYLNLDRVADAKAVLRRLLPMAGATDRKFWYNVASVQLADGKADKACAALQHALEIDPGYALALSLRNQVCGH